LNKRAEELDKFQNDEAAKQHDVIEAEETHTASEPTGHENEAANSTDEHHNISVRGTIIRLASFLRQNTDNHAMTVSIVKF
jgi:hypothetical protein